MPGSATFVIFPIAYIRPNPDIASSMRTGKYFLLAVKPVNRILWQWHYQWQQNIELQVKLSNVVVDNREESFIIVELSVLFVFMNMADVMVR